MELTLPRSHSLQTKNCSLASSSSSSLLPLCLSLCLSVKQRQLQCIGTQGALAKLKSDSLRRCLPSVDHRFLIQPSPQTSQLHIQINALQLSPPTSPNSHFSRSSSLLWFLSLSQRLEALFMCGLDLMGEDTLRSAASKAFFQALTRSSRWVKENIQIAKTRGYSICWHHINVFVLFWFFKIRFKHQNQNPLIHLKCHWQHDLFLLQLLVILN